MPVEQIIDAAKEASIKDLFFAFVSILEYPAVILFTAMVVELILPTKKKWCLSGMAPLFSKAAAKVNRPENAISQTVFSGIFLPIATVTSFVLTLELLRFCVSSDVILSLILLPILLESKGTLYQMFSVKREIDNKNIESARAVLQQFMKRDCMTLSDMGICKALCEYTAMRMFINWFSIMVWYMILDLEGALVMQLVAVMNNSFNFKEKKNEVFGSFIYKLEQSLLFPVLIVFIPLMLCSFSAIRILKHLKQHITEYTSFISSPVLDLLGSYANISLGGPRLYNGSKIRLTRIGGANDPDSRSALRLYNKIRFVGVMFVCLCVIQKIVFSL